MTSPMQRESPQSRPDESGGEEPRRDPESLTSGSEEREAEERSSPRAAVVYEAIRREGCDELDRPSSALFWSGLAAGLSMGFSLVAEGLLHERLPDAPWRPLVTKLGYSVGFLIVILGRQQLFTENTLTSVLPLLQRWDGATLKQMLRLWSVVLAANVLGAFAFALVLAQTDVFDEGTRLVFATVAGHGAGDPFVPTFLRAIFAGWLVALLVWLLPFAETARIAVIVIITWLIGAAGFAHIVAGAVEAFYVGLTGMRSFGTLLVTFFIPTLAGNIVGGVTLVAALSHAQVANEGVDS
jgi:formate/nitrite transporter FocA (FNT family)